MIELTHTDLPLPVAPAMRTCGIRVRSTIWASPRMSFPSAMGISILGARKFSSRSSSPKPTMARCAFGISMPTACFPGMGATIRTLDAASRSAMLSDRFTILLSLTPGAGRISNMVMTGPFRIPVTSAWIPNSSRVNRRVSAATRVASSILQYWSSLYSSRRPSIGI